MDEMQGNNRVLLCGTPLSERVYSHTARGEAFYSVPLDIVRLSGISDRPNILVRESLLPELRPARSGLLQVEGELRSFNNRSGVGARLVLAVLARRLSPPDTPDWVNQVELRGAVCREPTHRLTPLGREICDLMVAVSRPYGKSDYIPCVVWGHAARRCARWEVGQHVHLSGRFQSREYIKNVDGKAEKRTAYEVSVALIEPEDTP